MHLARQNLAPMGALLFVKCARDFLCAPTNISPKVSPIYIKAKSDFNYHSKGDQSPVRFYSLFYP